MRCSPRQVHNPGENTLGVDTAAIFPSALDTILLLLLLLSFE
jgi:hypothetical protein